MEVYTHNLSPKCGPDGFNDLGLSHNRDSVVGLEESLHDGRSGLLLYHGRPDEEVVRLLTACRNLSVLCVSSDRVQIPEELTNRFRPRLHALPWPWPDLRRDLDEKWTDTPAWRRDRLKAFLAQAREERGSATPDWTVLEPPVTDALIACYLCTLTGTSPEESWKGAFDEQASYGAAMLQYRMPAPTFDSAVTSQGARQLRDFLLALGHLQEGRGEP